MGTKDGELSKIGVGGQGLDLEREGWGEGGARTMNVTEEEMVVGLEGIGSEEKLTESDVGEVFGAFEERWAGVAAFGGTVADEEAGDVVFDETLVEGGEQTMETLVGPPLIGGEQAHAWVEDDETGSKFFDGR
jgi:hypothetical protein